MLSSIKVDGSDFERTVHDGPSICMSSLNWTTENSDPESLKPVIKNVKIDGHGSGRPMK